MNNAARITLDYFTNSDLSNYTLAREEYERVNQVRLTDDTAFLAAQYGLRYAVIPGLYVVSAYLTITEAYVSTAAALFAAMVLKIKSFDMVRSRTVSLEHLIQRSENR